MKTFYREKQDCGWYPATPQKGQGRVIIKCAYCGTLTAGFTFGLASNGKKCSNKKCGALLTHGMSGTFAWRGPYKDEE